MGIRERMQNGQIYTDLEEGLPQERLYGKELVYDYNLTRPSEEDKRNEILKRLFGHVGKNIWIEPPLRVAYGNRTYIGDNFYANFNLVLVDDINIFIGNNVMFAPNVTISTTGHPVHPDLRKNGEQFSFPVKIEDNVWIGSNVVILPGVTIGENSVIGAGSVVTKDIPKNVVAVGNPCKVLRPITDRDRKYYYKDLKVDDI
ncbi:galactoside O-acetyltransferase [Clostridium sartagoforme AAU1]|jgi:galactoside O-acetyltransferase|uniref:Acetyltransferase n=1 Tax=Clostridium sartagoforme AAU1 TaxID=1202534 RepID=R9BV13_9CLOT|nr:maltose acetyltransferase domain-containing protein [Clostridium sartagoforme]EOR20883.1 galactoside O-acetyltransferase [Clostridium sartagoforme AAU1]